MSIQRLTVVYNGPEDEPYIDVELDAALEKTLAEFGLHRWASGCDLVPPFERDLAFQREVVPEPNVKSDGDESYRAGLRGIGCPTD